MKLVSIVVVLSLVALAGAVGVEDEAFVSNGFDYCGGATNGEWAGGDCVRDEQSPIVLPAMTGNPQGATNNIVYTAGTGTGCSVVNNGHTLKWSCTAGSLGSFNYRTKVFNIKQFHVHFPSEHKFGVGATAQAKAGEVHFVAFRAGSNEAAPLRGDVIAVGALVNRVDCPATQASPFFNNIAMNRAPANAQTCARRPTGPGAAAAAANKGALSPNPAPTKFMFREMITALTRQAGGHGGGHTAPAAPAPLPVANIELASTFASLTPSSTAQYEGSLTTPPCSRVVTHVVIVDKYLSACGTDIDNFLGTQVGANARPIQPQGSRQIVYGLFNAPGAAAAPTAPAPGAPAAPTAAGPAAAPQKVVGPAPARPAGAGK